MSNKNLRQSEANVAENRDSQHRLPTADLSLFSTCYMFA